MAIKFLKYKELLRMGKSDIWETYPMLKLTLKISTLCYPTRMAINSLASTGPIKFHPWFGVDDLPVRLPKMMLLVLRAAGRCATRTSVSSQYCQCRVGSEGKQVPSSVQPATTFGYVVKPTNQPTRPRQDSTTISISHAIGAAPATDTSVPSVALLPLTRGRTVLST